MSNPLPLKILTIEDDQTTADEIAAELSAHGFTVEIVGDGKLGLDKARNGGYDAITLDRMLPGLDGLSVVTRLRAAGIDTRNGALIRCLRSGPTPKRT